MNILITGGNGFIGNAFCNQLRKNKSLFIVNIDKLQPCSKLPEHNDSNYIFIKGDITNYKLIESILKQYNIQYLIHFAAQSHVDTSFTNPLVYTNDNILGTHVLLEASVKYGKIEKFIQISTDEVYGENLNDNSFTENSILKPSNPYSATKAAAEMLVHSYIKSYNLPAIIIRSNNIYGPGQYTEKVIPKFITNILTNKKSMIHGSGFQKRSFLYIDDVVDAINCVLNNGIIGEIYNISSTNEIDINTLACKINRAFNVDNTLIYTNDRNFNDNRYFIDSQKLQKIGWSQKIDFDTGLTKTIKWYQNTDLTNYWMTNPDAIDTKKVLIYGSNGWIGTIFKNMLHKTKNWTVLEGVSRCDNKKSLLDEIDKYNPDCIISLIGRTHGKNNNTIDYLEQPGKLQENVNDNLYSPLLLGFIAKEKNIHMIYFGTGCIFEYTDEKTIFHKDDDPNFFGSSYSIIKGFTDRMIRENFNDSCLNVRIRMPIHSIPHKRNFISKIINYENICSIQNSMSVLDDILPFIITCMNKKTTGTINAVNPGTIDHNTILNYYKQLQNPMHTWNLISNETLIEKFVHSKRSNNELQSSIPDLPDINISIIEILRKNLF